MATNTVLNNSKDIQLNSRSSSFTPPSKLSISGVKDSKRFSISSAEKNKLEQIEEV
jgi:hypothetical protein